MNHLPDLDDPASNAVLGLASAQSAELRQQAMDRGFAIREIQLGTLGDETGLFAECARALDLPDWFGHNRDALADCLMDLSWFDVEGYLLILQDAGKFAARAPALSESLREILLDACLFWRDEGRVFVVLAPADAGA